jgi:ribosomal-protein-alanine N-acetyltransferase
MSDLDNMRELESDGDIMKFTSMRIPQSLDQTKERLEGLIHKENQSAPLGVWAAELKDDRDFLGWFMLLEKQPNFPELGFMMVKRHWGKGLATEVASEIIRFGFEVVNLKSIAATTVWDNVASIRVLEKLGFSFLKTAGIPDPVLSQSIDINFYELKNPLVEQPEHV